MTDHSGTHGDGIVRDLPGGTAPSQTYKPRERRGKVLQLTFPAGEWAMLTEFVYGAGKMVTLVEFKAMMRERIERG